jgi:cytochrome c-type biogenesis protein CcsB
MRVIIRFFFVAMLFAGARSALAIGMDQAKPSPASASPMNDPNASLTPTAPSEQSAGVGAAIAEDRSAFEQEVKLDQFRLLAVENSDQIKILDSWARQSLSKIRGRQTIDGQDPLYTALDIAFRRDAWADKNVIYVQAVPIRQQLAPLAASAAEGDRLLHDGLVSYNFLDRGDVQQKLNEIGLDMRQVQAVNKVQMAHTLFQNLVWTLLMLPPDAAHRADAWKHPVESQGNILNEKPEWGGVDLKTLPPIDGITVAEAQTLKKAMDNLLLGWVNADAAKANQGIATLVEMLPQIDPAGYPSSTKRITELWYNRTFYGTIANVFLYFIAMTLFLMVAVGVTNKLETPALCIFALAVALHITAMAIRWWLAGRIPIQNQFESVLGSAMLGCIVGLFLELWKRKGIFGVAFSFVGFFAMTACFSAPYVLGTDLGGAVGKVAGILGDYWLYIHVNIVISSYALIAASFLIGVLYLSMKLWYWINPIEPEGDIAADLPGLTDSPTGMSEHATTMTRSTVHPSGLETQRLKLLEGLDQANMVILQMAFWFLGTGIICGAVWADHSWGRPWGWDPKETFALVTWIVYLVIVHLRFVTKARSDVTAWLSVVGFAVMMFNWIGVNFWLVGLHSYA